MYTVGSPISSLCQLPQNGTYHHIYKGLEDIGTSFIVEKAGAYKVICGGSTNNETYGSNVYIHYNSSTENTYRYYEHTYNCNVGDVIRFSSQNANYGQKWCGVCYIIAPLD